MCRLVIQSLVLFLSFFSAVAVAQPAIDEPTACNVQAVPEGAIRQPPLELRGRTTPTLCFFHTLVLCKSAFQAYKPNLPAKNPCLCDFFGNECEIDRLA